MTWMRCFVFVAMLLAAGIGQVRAQSPDDSPRYRDLLSRLEAQEAELRALRQQVERGTTYPTGLITAGQSDDSCDCPEQVLRRLPAVVDLPLDPCRSEDETPTFFKMRFYADYDNGFVIRPVNRETDPFEIKMTGWIQFRHVGFARDVTSWTDNAGTTRPVRNRNNFETERARLAFSGYALSPQLTYFLQLDGDTDGRETVDFFDYWWGYRFSDSFQLQMGKRKVPGSRQWLLGARRTRFVDRPMVNDFFRPDRTVGLFAVGQIGESFHYEAMVGNGVRTSNRSAAEINDKFAFATTAYWDPWGDFGKDLTAYRCSEDPLLRLGSSFTYGPQSGLSAAGTPLGESDFVRLTDGTQLTTAGALAGGVTVNHFDLYLLSVDAAVKWGSWSFNAEAFFRWLEDIAGNGALPTNQLYQRGYYVEGGTFIIPQTFDWNVRYSQINGAYGDAAEYAIGINWFPLDTHRMKISFDVSHIESSPLNHTPIDILVGDDGTLFRTQFQAEF